jgi:hypothetical protein
MKHLIAVLIALTAFLPVPIRAQEEATPSFTLYGGAVLPSGTYTASLGYNPGVTRRFGFDIGEDAGLAAVGGAVGCELRLPVLTDGMEWVVSMQGLVNGMRTDDVLRVFREDVKDTVAISMSTGAWIHLPLFTGLMYGLDLGQGTHLDLTAQGGIHVTRQASRTVAVNGAVVEETTFRFMPDFGYQVGVGIAFSGGYQILLRYVDLGTPRYEGTQLLNEKFFTSIPRRENTINGDPRRVAMFLIAVGYTL